jgi:indolepyruvate ferredoxin oxidoreductase beta subunit
VTAPAERPLTVLVAALGGEGGGVLSNWLVSAAAAEDYPVQSTSIPGVAQRTGATTYYIEIFPVPLAELAGRQPVMALTPSPGNVDVMVASELLEAGRALQNGLVTPERTTLIASNHRVYAIGEKSAMGDGRYDAVRVLQAAGELTSRAVLFDMAQAAREAGSVINAVLFGAIAGIGVLPISRETFEGAIRRSGIAVEANLAGFAAGFAIATRDQGIPESTAEDETRRSAAAPPSDLWERIEQTYPAAARGVVEAGVARLIDYQDEAYANLYLEQLDSVLALDRSFKEAEGAEAEGGYRLTAECGRYLALWMAYDDIIRVADLKTRASRLERVRAEVGAAAGEPIAVVEFLKPGFDEVLSVLPRWLARPGAWLGRRLGLEHGANFGLHLRSTSISGFVALRLTAGLKRWRRRTSRYADEQAAIARWLAAIDRAARLEYDLALEVVECARLIKGYSDTQRRGARNFQRLMETVVAPALAADHPAGAAAAIARARTAALADADGLAFEETLAALAESPEVEAAPPLAAAGE